MSIDFSGCQVAFVSNASTIDRLAVYYADSDGHRRALYGITPTTTQRRTPIRVSYQSNQDRTKLQLPAAAGGLVHVVAEVDLGTWVTATNPNSRCVPSGYNQPPTASFTVSDSAPAVGDSLTLASTATDPNSPERIHYEWDLDGDGTYEATGPMVTHSLTIPGDLTIRHRVTDDFGETDVAEETISVAPVSFPKTQVAKLLAGDGQTRDDFGRSVCIDGDTALVGANNEDETGDNAGTVYVFERNTEGEWVEETKLTASDAQAFDLFGTSVSLDGDTALVGAPLSNSGFGGGAVYVFVRDSNGMWSEQAILSTSLIGGYFGWAVDIDGDTALIGAPLHDLPNWGDGAAYVFVRDQQGNWSEQAKLSSGSSQQYEFLGSSVSLDSDTALLGLNYDGEYGVNATTAYVFVRDSNGGWTKQAELTGNDLRDCDLFAWSVSLDGDTALLGSICVEDDLFGDGEPDKGSAYIFGKDESGDWTEQARLTASDGHPNDYFGYSASLIGEVALVGAPYHEEEGVVVGAIYVFVRDEQGEWVEQTKLTASDGQFGDRFGYSVSYNGTTAVVGADLEGETADFAGAAYVFE